MDSKALRKNTVETLGLLAERFPNLRIGQIIGNSITGSVPDLYYLSDEELARGLNQLFVTYTQFEAAGIMKSPEGCRDCAESMFGQCDRHRHR